VISLQIPLYTHTALRLNSTIYASLFTSMIQQCVRHHSNIWSLDRHTQLHASSTCYPIIEWSFSISVSGVSADRIFHPSPFYSWMHKVVPLIVESAGQLLRSTSSPQSEKWNQTLQQVILYGKSLCVSWFPIINIKSLDKWGARNNLISGVSLMWWIYMSITRSGDIIGSSLRDYVTVRWLCTTWMLRNQWLLVRWNRSVINPIGCIHHMCVKGTL
jgi:hypothetical protein